MERIIHLRINLNNIAPEIWRGFLVKENISFHRLHNIIQKVMGWQNYHAYYFQVGKELIEGEGDAGICVDLMWRQLKQQAKGKNSKKIKVCEIIKEVGQKFAYVYDLGDNWLHTLQVEKISEAEEGRKYPMCIEGQRACPPEDSGGTHGYRQILQIKNNKNHPDYKEMVVGWLGEDFDQEHFDAEIVNLRLHSKDNAPVWAPKQEFVPLGKLLKDDFPAVKNITTLHNREEEYEAYLGEVERTIAEFFLDNPELKDKDVKKALKNIKKSYTQDLDFFQDDLEKQIILGLSYALQEKTITPHELKLVLNYVLWSLDNRSWMPDKQAFVKWLSYFFGMYDKKQAKEYEDNMRKVAKRFGIPSDKVDMMLMSSDESPSAEEKAVSTNESEFFALDDDEKFDFVIKHINENPYLFQQYIAELEEEKDYQTIEKLCKTLMENSGNFPMFEFILGLNYHVMGNKALAQHHMENAIKTLENAPADWISHEEREKILKDMHNEIKRISK